MRLASPVNSLGINVKVACNVSQPDGLAETLRSWMLVSSGIMHRSAWTIVPLLQRCAKYCSQSVQSYLP